MTTIVYDPNVRVLASDSRMTNESPGGDLRVSVSDDKIRHLYDAVLGFAGSAAYSARIIRDLTQRFQDEGGGSFYTFAVNQIDIWDRYIRESNNGISVLMFHENYHIGCELHVGGVMMPINVKEIHGIGTGAPFAMGALAAGATVEQAIKIASRFDLQTDDCVVTHNVCRKEYVK